VRTIEDGLARFAMPLQPYSQEPRLLADFLLLLPFYKSRHCYDFLKKKEALPSPEAPHFPSILR
jgi:hypothetical protein